MACAMQRVADRLLKFEREHPDVAVSAVCAHEFGHITAIKYGLMKRLKDGQPSVKRSELHADFLAGYFAGVVQAPMTAFAFGFHTPMCGRWGARPMVLSAFVWRKAISSSA